MRLKQLPISIIKKPKSKSYKKCEKAILMMARVPPWPAAVSKILKGCDEFHPVESWIATSLNARILVTALSKSDFYLQFIEKERKMPNLHLGVLETDDALQLIVEGVITPIVIAEHLRFIARQLTSKGTASIVIVAFDGGQQAVNHCEHAPIPNVQELGRGTQAYHSLQFQFQGDEALLIIDRNRLVPLSAVQISVDES
jgi:hypothetical protein